MTFRRKIAPILRAGVARPEAMARMCAGTNRLHQFDKVEIVRIEKPENSYAALEEMKDHVQGLLEKLGLPWHILRLCGGDMSFTSAITFDFEVWAAAPSGAGLRFLRCLTLRLIRQTA